VTAAWALAQSPQGSDQFYNAIRGDDLRQIGAMLDHGADVNAKDQRGITPLMYAAAVGSLEAMQRLLDKGADANARNAAGSTALMWTATDIAKTRLLLQHHADATLVSNRGRSALFVAAMSDHSADIVRLLLANRADTHVLDETKMTALHAATVGSDAETIRLFLDAGLTVNAADAGGFTPLMNAAQRGNVEAVNLLLARGADPNIVSALGDPSSHVTTQVKNGTLALGHFTALLLAATSGSADMVRMLLRAGADANAQDLRGMTPLMTAVATDYPDADLVRAMLAAGADVQLKSRDNQTALDWAQKFGPTPIVALLKRTGATAVPAVSQPIPEASSTTLRPAVERSAALLERTSRSFFVNGGCSACHAQNVTDIALALARPKGIRVSDEEAASRRSATTARFAANVPALLERFDGAGVPDIALYSLAGLASAGYPPDRMTDALIVNVAAQQRNDGRWHAGGMARPPIQESDVVRTALAVRALTLYAPPGRRTEMRRRVQAAVAWLRATLPLTAQDRNLRLLGLHWGEADAHLLQDIAKSIFAAQRPDGGWAQRDELSADAYATGQTLVALSEGADAAAAPEFDRGVQYLLSTQRADGSWYVRSRAPKFQPYFESGFPYGDDQWISSMATGWATAALATALTDAHAAHPVQ